MAKTLSKTGITNGSTIEVGHVTQSVDAFTGTEAYDITISGSLILSDDTQIEGTSSVAISSSYALTASYALNGGGGGGTIDTGSFFTGAELVPGEGTADQIVFTQGDSTTETITLPNSLATASIAGSTLTFTKEDTSTFDLTLPSSTVNTGSLLNNASKTSGRENSITFTKGDSTTFDVQLAAIPTSFASSTGGTFETTPDPTGKSEAGWVDIIIGGTTYYIPVWTDAG